LIKEEDSVEGLSASEAAWRLRGCLELLGGLSRSSAGLRPGLVLSPGQWRAMREWLEVAEDGEGGGGDGAGMGELGRELLSGLLEPDWTEMAEKAEEQRAGGGGPGPVTAWLSGEAIAGVLRGHPEESVRRRVRERWWGGEEG
jgi:hypothetical protein